MSALGWLACSARHLHIGDDGAGGGHAGGGGGQAGAAAGVSGTAGAAGAAAGAAGSIMPAGTGGSITPAGTGGAGASGGTGGVAPPPARRLTGLDNRIIEFPPLTPEATPTTIASGPDSNLWYTNGPDFYSILSVISSGFADNRDTTARNGEVPGGLVAGPDGAIWLTMSKSWRQAMPQTPPSIYRLNVTGGATIFALDTGATPQQITVGPDDNLWFTDPGLNRIGRITTAGLVTAYPIPTGASGPLGITAGPDGALWFTETTANQIGRVTTGGSVTEWPIPTATASPQLITAAPDGALWFTEMNANQIGRVTTSGAFTEFALPTANSKPFGITAGPDDAVWFTESAAYAIGRITPAGAVTEYVTTRPYWFPWSITVGPDGDLWFTNQQQPGGAISRLTPESKPFARLWTNLIAPAACPGLTQSIQVENQGNMPSGQLTVDLDDANPARSLYRIRDNCSGTTLDPGGQCTIDFSLAPGATLTPSSLTITIRPVQGDAFVVRAAMC